MTNVKNLHLCLFCILEFITNNIPVNSVTANTGGRDIYISDLNITVKITGDKINMLAIYILEIYYCMKIEVQIRYIQ